MADIAEEIVVAEDGFSLPVTDVLTGRGAVFGKSGSGKSNSANVIAEELLEEGLPLLIVDQDGEYFGLKQEYEMLHVGADEDCDAQVGLGQARAIADIALEENVPVILDVSGFIEREEANALVNEVVRRLFAREKEVRKPFLLVVEEVHEFIPETGGLDDLGKMLIRVAKRGRKRGLGLCGISQRPAAVDKDFITQCDWIVWHRLTWDNDTKVVGKILGGDYADHVQELDDGEGVVMADWEPEIRDVRFRRKRTFDAGATPGLDDYSRPELKSVNDELVERLEGPATPDAPDDTEELQALLDEKRQRVADLRNEVGRLQHNFAKAREAIEELEAENERLRAEGGAAAGTGDAADDVTAAGEDTPAADDASGADDEEAGAADADTEAPDDGAPTIGFEADLLGPDDDPFEELDDETVDPLAGSSAATGGAAGAAPVGGDADGATDPLADVLGEPPGGTEADGGRAEPEEPVAYRGNPVWEIGQMFAYLFAAVITAPLRPVERLLSGRTGSTRLSDPLSSVGGDVGDDWRRVAVALFAAVLVLTAAAAYLLFRLYPVAGG